MNNIKTNNTETYYDDVEWTEMTQDRVHEPGIYIYIYTIVGSAEWTSDCTHKTDT